MIVVEPLATPVTIPVPGVTVAIDVLLLLHVPLATASENGVVDPEQIFVAPLIVVGEVSTVTVVVIEQVVGN